MVRAKFLCKTITRSVDGAEITLEPVYGDTEENKKFFKYTPYGEIKVGTVNKAAADQFSPGKEYFVDFTPAS